jgi:D-alanine--poly(phosphoribitol) ligase subunit 1
MNKRQFFDQKSPVLSGIITEYAGRTPDRNAVKDGTTAYSFGEVETLSNNLARELVETHKVAVGDRVLFIAEKASEIIIAVIATWKAGAVYVPVDRNNGANRTLFIIDNVSPSVIISSAEMLKKFAEVIGDIPTISYEQIRAMDKEQDHFKQRPIVTEEDVAIILHTSGSTGNPKGVVLEHKSVVAYFRAHNLLYLFDEDSKNINYGPYHFDVSIQDTFLPLYFGAAVYVYKGMLIAPIVIDLILREGATHVVAVSSVLALITGEKDEIQKLKASKLQMCMTGGEICDTMAGHLTACTYL